MAGRTTNLTGSTYVSGNIDTKSRGRWVDAIPDLDEFDVTALSDEELGLTLKACGRMKTNASNALHKLNQKGGRQGWTAHNSAEKRRVEGEQVKILEFHEVLTKEADKREKGEDGGAEEPEQYFTPPKPAEPSPLSPTGPCHAVDLIIPTEAEDPPPTTGPTAAELFELFGSTSNKELMELAYAGLQAEKVCVSPVELENLREDLKITNKLLEDLRLESARRKELLEQARDDKKRLEVENKKLKRLIKGVQTEATNTANRLRKYFDESETEPA